MQLSVSLSGVIAGVVRTAVPFRESTPVRLSVRRREEEEEIETMWADWWGIVVLVVGWLGERRHALLDRVGPTRHPSIHLSGRERGGLEAAASTMMMTRMMGRMGLCVE